MDEPKVWWAHCGYREVDPHPECRGKGFCQRVPDFDVEWFTSEVVAYYKIFDFHDVWTAKGARRLGEWLRTHRREDASAD